MRGADAMQESLFTVAKLDDFVPGDHPLRSIRMLVNETLTALNSRSNDIYAASGGDSIAPEKLLRALLLQEFYSIRSERQLCERLRYNLLYRWFVGVALNDPIWDHSTFSKNRERLLARQVVEGFFARRGFPRQWLGRTPSRIGLARCAADDDPSSQPWC